MKVFKSNNGSDKIIELRENSRKKVDDSEKLLQTLVENNLSAIFPGLEFLTTEYHIDNLRPDSIAFDNEKNSFVIIEYKNIKHRGVIDQGMSYYSLLQERKENFVLLYHKIKGVVLNVDANVNWDETRVIFISREFTEHQKRAYRSWNLPIELYEISKFDEGIILFNKMERKGNAGSKSRKSIFPSILEGYSEEEYLDGKYRSPAATEQNKKMYFELKNKILEDFPGIEYVQKTRYAGFYSKNDDSIICTVEVKQNLLELCYCVKQEGVISIEPFVKDVSDKGGWGMGNYLSEIKDGADVEKAIPLIEKVYQFKSSS